MRIYWLLFCGAVWCTPGIDAAETRESYDEGGLLTRSLTLDGDRVTSETTYLYDASDRIVEARTSADGILRSEKNEWLPSGRLGRTERWEGDRLLVRKSFLYQGGRLASVTVETLHEPSLITTYEYDHSGNRVLTEVRNQQGDLMDRTVATRARPAVPIHLELNASLDYQSESDYQQAYLGFEVTRKPLFERYGSDPLEVAASGYYRNARSRKDSDAGPFTVQDLDALGVHFGIDYNFVLPSTTLFLFTTLERNTLASLQADLLVAPLGIKWDLVPRNPWVVDIGFAPVWNFRAIGEESTESSTTRLRGSFRFRVLYNEGRWKVSNTLDALPNLVPDDRSWATALQGDSILRNTFQVRIKLSSHLFLRQELAFVRDPSLRDQASVACDSPAVVAGTSVDTDLCQGFSFSATTTLGLEFDVAR